jgi:hypothetical protein
MDPETKELLRQNVELSKQNNQMLQKLVRAQKLAVIYRFVYWGIILFSTFGLYYFIQPFLGNLLNMYTGGVSGSANITDTLKNLGDKEQIKQLLETIQQ